MFTGYDTNYNGFVSRAHMARTTLRSGTEIVNKTKKQRPSPRVSSLPARATRLRSLPVRRPCRQGTLHATHSRMSLALSVLNRAISARSCVTLATPQRCLPLEQSRALYTPADPWICAPRLTSRSSFAPMRRSMPRSGSTLSLSAQPPLQSFACTSCCCNPQQPSAWPCQARASMRNAGIAACAGLLADVPLSE